MLAREYMARTDPKGIRSLLRVIPATLIFNSPYWGWSEFLQWFPKSWEGLWGKDRCRELTERAPYLILSSSSISVPACNYPNLFFHAELETVWLGWMPVNDTQTSPLFTCSSIVFSAAGICYSTKTTKKAFDFLMVQKHDPLHGNTLNALCTP